MNKFNQMRKIKNIVAICFVSFVVVAIISVYSFVLLGKTRAENLGYAEEIQRLENEKKSLESEIEYVQSDAYVDEQARENLGMVKEGEIIYNYNM